MDAALFTLSLEGLRPFLAPADRGFWRFRPIARPDDANCTLAGLSQDWPFVQ
jgi:hypothetical protein